MPGVGNGGRGGLATCAASAVGVWCCVGGLGGGTHIEHGVRIRDLGHVPPIDVLVELIGVLPEHTTPGKR